MSQYFIIPMGKTVVQVLEDSVGFVAGMPHPDWSEIRPFIELNVPQDLQAAAWTTAASHWVVTLQRALGERYGLAEHRGMMLLSPFDGKQRKLVLEFAKRSSDRILAELAPAARITVPGPIVIVHIDETRAYDRYISRFYPAEGSFMASGGIFVPAGYSHIVVHGPKQDAVEAVLAHELTHAALGHRKLPRWLDEGTATLMEQELYDRYWYLRDHAGEIPIVKGTEEVRRFLSGSTFTGAHRAAEQSYVLAQAMVRLILRDRKDKFIPFLQAASEADNGEAAARDILGISLVDLVSELYGLKSYRSSRHTLSSPTNAASGRASGSNHVVWTAILIAVCIALMAAIKFAGSP